MLCLCITGFEADPDRVTEILEITPTSVGRKGEPHRKGRPRTFNGWWLDVHEERLMDGGEHHEALNLILAKLQGKEARFRTLRETLNPRKTCIYGGLEHRPGQQCGIFLDVEQMRLLADCGVEWGLDLFTHSETTFVIDCQGVRSEGDSWALYLKAIEPEGGAVFGRNLAAFRDAILAGGPGWPGKCTLSFINTDGVRALHGGVFYDALWKLSCEAKHVTILLE